MKKNNDRLTAAQGLNDPTSVNHWFNTNNRLHMAIKNSLLNANKEVVRRAIITVKHTSGRETKLHRGETLVFAGMGGVGKGHILAHMLARCLAPGAGIFTGDDVKRILYLTAEEFEEEVYEKFRKNGVNGRLLEQVHVLSSRRAGRDYRLQENDMRTLTDIGRLIQEQQKSEYSYDIIVFDSLIDHINVNADESSNSQMASFMGLLRQIGGEDALVILVHHSTKQDKEKNGGIRGAGAIANSARVGWVLRSAFDLKNAKGSTKLNTTAQDSIENFEKYKDDNDIFDFINLDVVKANNARKLSFKLLLKKNGVETEAASSYFTDAGMILNGDSIGFNSIVDVLARKAPV